MALNNEDKKDVQKHMGKALANKVSKVTKDKAWKNTGTWVDKIDRSKHDTATINRWVSESKRAKKDFKPSSEYPSGFSKIS